MLPQSVDRRRFLRMATLGTLAGGNLLCQQRAEAGSQPPQVLIIGGGMAGASAAYWLRALGINAVILEAQDRLGGRIYSSKQFAGATLDMGAAWIHDSKNSPLTYLTQAFGIQTFLTDFTFLMYGLKNQLFSQDDFLAIAFDYVYLMAIVQQYRAYFMRLGLPDQPLGNVIDPVLKAMNLPPEEHAGVQTLIDNTMRNHFGVELRELSLYYWDQDKNVTQVFDLAFPGGYVQLVEALWQRSLQPLVTNCQVQQIIYNTPNGVTAVTNKGNFSAQSAIVTLPIGVLQRCQGANPIVQFTPSLPYWKLLAINGLQMGVWDKLAFQFESNFWGQTQFLKNTQPHSQYTIWFNPAPMINKAILVPVVFGDHARLIETLSDTQVKAGVLKVLNDWFPPQGHPVSKLVDFHRSSWGTNVYSYGCYPHIPAGASGAHYDLMSLPVPFGGPARLFFAGDGTHRTHCGSVWGAYESGMREAIRVWTFLNPGKRVASLAQRRFPGMNLPPQFHPSQVWQASQANLKEAHRVVQQSSRKK